LAKVIGPQGGKGYIVPRTGTTGRAVEGKVKTTSSGGFDAEVATILREK